eukprot:CAMPEP_0117502906 /NCGR_PEP_ID=MMETSP0784-20121206/24053_1 /TAXON_ID=39447 /ORGANISM="" /LENGTH=42 /DNA_ID= /DNA_START= /DNA_END= /DNA_ORIENTATION=
MGPASYAVAPPPIVHASTQFCEFLALRQLQFATGRDNFPSGV